ncbi:uncharacterized protein LOC131220771 isoform X2 [Magnolia sinica]|uniref:uncharacterized protein LOC131220771 isoform X2 n=1 Tax=Magnolia sinica TaxID=86752 RepID=UPI00265A64E8|nr:uncharacterized protein LOC131220771 isoform X2 [Magnolia sinica]
MFSLRFSFRSLPFKEILTPFSVVFPQILSSSSSLGKTPRNVLPSSRRSIQEIPPSASRFESPSTALDGNTSSFSGVEDALLGFICGKRKVTEVAHSVWKHVICKGDTVVDATCGNGHDTLALLKMVADESGKGCVYGMDIQNSALENTSSLLDESVDPKEKELVKLFLLCHSRMEDVIPEGTSVRLVAFNLGYLPGGDKAIITTSRTTLLALEAASRILGSGGLISAMVYVGHPGGRTAKEFHIFLCH